MLGDFNNWGINGSIHISTMRNINEDRKFVTFRDFGSPDDIYYSSEFVPAKQDTKFSSFSDHNILYTEFEMKS